MKRASSYWTLGTVKTGIAILMLAAILAVAPKVFAWGRGVFGGGFGGEGFGGGGFNQAGGFNQGEGYGGGSSNGGASQTYIYPSRGQSPQQEQNDRGQCYTWAVQQSRFDPANPQIPGGPPPAVGAPQGGLFRGAAGGAALGAIGGAIGGNAGKGAAIGGATGALFGGMRRRRWAEQEQFQQSAYMQQQQNALNQGRSNFNQAFGVCMTGRGYTVG
jgi:Glycine zipper